jgi:hypothetical protein
VLLSSLYSRAESARMRERIFVMVTALVVSACGSPASPSPDDALKGGVVATFAVGSETFRVWIRNTNAIDQVLALQRGTSTESIPNGRLRVGAGQGGHNAPFSWHLDPDDIQMAGATIEICDGTPSYIEAHRDEFIAQVNRYCPWGARLLGVVDHR